MTWTWVGAQPSGHRALDKRVLVDLALAVLLNLSGGRLANVHIRGVLEVADLDLLSRFGGDRAHRGSPDKSAGSSGAPRRAGARSGRPRRRSGYEALGGSLAR